MPQKANGQLDYEEELDMNDDYNISADDHFDVEREERLSKLEKTLSKPGHWKCSICTYDNSESLLSCDICGVFRDPSSTLKNDVEGEVDRTYKDSEPSIMAKSLLARIPCQTPKTTVISSDFLCKGGNILDEQAKTKACFGGLHNIFLSSNRTNSITIAPFRFDTLSPDDIVSFGKNSSRSGSKVSPAQSPDTRASSSITGNNGIVKFLPKSGIVENPSTSRAESSHVSESERSSTEEIEAASQAIASKLHHLIVDKKSRSSRKAASLAQYKPENWMLSDKGKETHTQLNLAIVGHVDSGKSTLCGRLLHLLGRVSKKDIHKYEKEAKEKGKGSFAYAWAMDESTEERERGITMTVAVAYFESKKYRVVILDSPGHKDFVPNMISGATQADAAILVVDASIGSFEAGMGSNGIGQTREHAQLVRSFGVEQIIIAVNKMDTVEYSKERFDVIKLQLGSFLRTCGFKESLLTWIPLSAMKNENLVEAPSDVRLSCWFQGVCLLDAIDSLQSPQRDLSKPPLLPICDVIASHSLGQVAACGKLENGALRSGYKLLVMPSGDLATVRSIERDCGACPVARAGDNVAVGLQGVDGGHVVPGAVLCHPDFPVTVASSLELKVHVLEISMPILVGIQVEFLIHHAKRAARVVKILSLLDQKTGKVSKRTPRMLTAKQSAVIEVALDEPTCAAEFSSCRALGRAFLRASGSTIAVGIVTRIINPEL